LKSFKVVEKNEITEENSTTFKIHLKPVGSMKFRSGDLLAVYPENNHKERFYSIGKVNGNIQLVVKLFENGSGSRFLYCLKNNDEIKARIIKNKEFHIPKSAKKIAMIANGTGIAPFLGMIEENTGKKEIHLYCGFRKSSELTESYRSFANENIKREKLRYLHFAYSREENSQYVMDLIKKDASFFTGILKEKNCIMICGSLQMQQDVENILQKICSQQQLDYHIYKNNGQILTDCY